MLFFFVRPERCGTPMALGISAAETMPTEGVWGTRKGMNQWNKSETRVFELSILRSGWEDGKKKNERGGPQCMLLSSLQGLCSTELICCEMCKYCLDWCLVCRRDGEEEKEDRWGELWGGSLMKQDLKRWNHPQGGRGPHSKPPCYPCITESIPLAHINKKICHGGGNRNKSGTY